MTLTKFKRFALNWNFISQSQNFFSSTNFYYTTRVKFSVWTTVWISINRFIPIPWIEIGEIPLSEMWHHIMSRIQQWNNHQQLTISGKLRNTTDEKENGIWLRFTSVRIHFPLIAEHCLDLFFKKRIKSKFCVRLALKTHYRKILVIVNRKSVKIKTKTNLKNRCNKLY